MKGITLCADCAYYDLKKHKCNRGATVDPDISKGQDVRFYVDCPLPESIPAVNRWISVEDALPEENVRCLVYTEGGGYGISRRMGRNLEKWNCFGLQVTHWMNLPEPPESEV